MKQFISPHHLLSTLILRFPPVLSRDACEQLYIQGTIGCTPNSVPMVFIVVSRDSWGF